MKDVSQEAERRMAGLSQWARSLDLDTSIPQSARLAPVSDDASFRRYFRFSEGARGLVFVDAPPEHEDNESFVKISAALCKAGLYCPEVKAVDYKLGYMAVTDLGNRLYLDELRETPTSTTSLYHDAVQTILRLIPIECDLPHYDAGRLQMEMNLFHEWFLEAQLGVEVTRDLTEMLDGVYTCLVESALEQPAGFVHRDFHCRNLMVSTALNPGIIDFQDAVIGPLTYDLVSLYKDCYYRFDRASVVRAVENFHQELVLRGLAEQDAPMLRWFDLMGAQRHLKCLGIFSRLNLRDGKPGYLGDIPLVVDYLLETSERYPELGQLHDLLTTRVVPGLDDITGVRR